MDRNCPALELDDLIDEVLEEAKKLYPIDETRIYGTGFSYGGYMSGTLGNKRPDVYAAVGPCGAPINNNYCSNEVGPEPQKPFDGKPRAIEMGVYMPIFTASGNLDGGRFPIYQQKIFIRGTSGGNIRRGNQFLGESKSCKRDFYRRSLRNERQGRSD